MSGFFIALIACLVVVSCMTPARPVWPPEFFADIELSIPYFHLEVPVKVHVSTLKNKQFISYYDGMDTYTYDFATGLMFSTFPRINTPTCQVDQASGHLVPVVPNIDEKWTYGGKTSDGLHDLWELVQKAYNFTNRYTLEVNGQIPVRLEQYGYNIVLGSSHPDHYVIKYRYFSPNIDHPEIFDPPSLCRNAFFNKNLHHRARAMEAMLFGPLQPNVTPLSEEFTSFVITHKKIYSDLNEMNERMTIFEKNLNMIKQHNANPLKNYRLGVTKFTDMEVEEIQRILIPTKFRRKEGFKPAKSNAKKIHERGNSYLPSYVNWVEKGVVTPPKDQGLCGSCWTFGTSGALEGAWAIYSGKLLSISEQQILDCAWFPEGNSGCDGGFAGEAFDWISSNNGIATEKDYPYLMVDGYCKMGIRDAGINVLYHVNVSASDEALRDALANHGPVAVAINAAVPDFYYIQGDGVYDNPECVGGIDDLDHEVLVVGYGTDVINGKNVDYWLLKNSWGVMWGNRGFWKMARNSPQPGGMCGIKQQPRFPVVGKKIQK